MCIYIHICIHTYVYIYIHKYVYRERDVICVYIYIYMYSFLQAWLDVRPPRRRAWSDLHYTCPACRMISCFSGESG